MATKVLINHGRCVSYIYVDRGAGASELIAANKLEDEIARNKEAETA